MIKNVIKPLAKSIWITLGLTAAPSSADAGIHKKVLGSGRYHSSSVVLRPPLCDAPHNTTLIISNDKRKDLIETVKALEDSGLLLKGVSETTQNEAKEQKGEFLSMLLGTLGVSLLGNILAWKGAIATNQGQGVNRAGEGIVRAGYGNKRIQKTTTKNKNNFKCRLIL